MKNISQEELKEILKKHEMWLRGEEGGERANLEDTNLKYSNLRGADLRNANLSYSDLYNANLYNANLECSNLRDADLYNANLEGANLKCSNLRGVNLSYTNLSYSDLRGADLRNADLTDASLRGADLRDINLSYSDLSGTNLWNADLRGSNLEDIKTNIHTIGYSLACPKEGSFIGYKKADKYIVKLLILDDAKRSSATTCKCRCDKAKVLEIENIDTGEKIEETKSNYDPKFIYKVGEIITVDDFDDNRWNECSTGIHFFMNKDNALNY